MNGVLAIRYKVNPEKENDFEEWKCKIDSTVSTFDGYQDTVHIHPIEQDDYHHIILRFNNKENLQKWIDSDFRAHMHNDFKGIWVSEKEESIDDWETFWFSKMKQMKRWKQWAVTFLAVYPLTVIIPYFINNFNKFFPLSFFKGILSAVLISWFMTFLVMPFMLKLFRNWLHK